MSDTGTSTGRFNCDTCHKSYRWTPQLAGKKVKCCLGDVLVSPIDEPRDPEDALYDLAPDPVLDPNSSATSVRPAMTVVPMANTSGDVAPAAASTQTISYQRAKVGNA